MAERLLDRRFNVLAAQADVGTSEPSVARERTKQDEEDALRKAGTPMDVQNAIARIQLAFKDKDYFRCGLTSRSTAKPPPALCSSSPVATPLCLCSRRVAL